MFGLVKVVVTNADADVEADADLHGWIDVYAIGKASQDVWVGTGYLVQYF